MRAMPARLTLFVVSLAAFVAACGDNPLANWPPESTEFEQEVLALINAQRDEGAVCGDEAFEPTHPLVMNERLQRAARLHSYDMFDREYFSHTNPDGDGPKERMDRAGYEGRTWGENIAGGSATPEAAMGMWMGSAGHCANIMRSSFEEIGVGTYERRWTLKFASPRRVD
jgi:uncharacterized protein YkwD